MNTPTQHIPFASLADMAENKLLGDELASARAHLSACSSCAGKLDRLQELIRLMRTDATEDAPRDVIAYALNIFQPAAATRQPSLVRRIVAALSFDSLNAAPAFGVRSGDTASRQLLFEVADHDLDLRLSPQGNDWVVSGQVLGSDCAGGEVALEGPASSAAAVLNDLCEFKLAPVPPGTYTLLMRLGEIEVEVPGLRLGA